MAIDWGAVVFDSLPSAVMVVDLDDVVVLWNHAAEELFGWTAEEVVGRPLPIVPDDAAVVRRNWIERVSAGEQIEEASERLHRDGHRIDVVLRFAPMRDADGERIGTVVQYRRIGGDPSSRRRDDTHLRQVRRLAELVQGLVRDLHLSAVVESIVQVAVEVLEADAGALSMEREPDQFLRVSNVNVPDDLTNHRIVRGEGLHGRVIDLGAPVSVGDYDTWDGAVDAFRGRNFHAAIGVPLVQHDRTIGVLSVHAFEAARRFDPENIEVLQLLADYAVVAIQNAEAYRHATAERERFMASVQAVAAGLVVVEDGRVTAWNDAAASLTGLPADEVLGRPPPLDLDPATGLEVSGVDGRIRFVEIVRSALPQGGSVYLIHDLTEHRDLERAKDLFFATTSHELKTPLTVVKGLASTLRLHWDRMPDDQRVDALATIERRADSLDRLIERILVGSRVQAEAFAVELMPIDVVPLIRDIVIGFDAAAPGHDVRADLPAEGLPLVAADRQVLDTILGHLLDNAVKYSPGGGPVIVRARSAIDEPTGAPRVRIDVRDHGIGIEGDMSRLLDPFVQAESHTTRRFSGVGLGLFIVRQMVDALGGSLSATNCDPGTEFIVTVPEWR